ncbi:MAG: HAD-IA family hydrolase [Candidatus Asgardarchaeia archaeon]
MRDRILITTANYKKAYPIIRSLARSGCEPIIAFTYWSSSPVFSRFVSRRYKVANPYIDEITYVKQIATIAEIEDVKMIIPVGFIDNLVVAKYRTLFNKEIAIPIPSYDKILYVSNKAKLAEMLSKIGIKYPLTFTLDDYLRNKKEQIGLPLVLKGISDASRPRYIITNQDFNNIKKSSSMIVQQFIPGTGHGYFCLAKDGKILLEFCHQRVIEYPPSGGPSVVACRYIDPELIRLGRKIVKYLNWTGVLMVEFKKNLETGEYYVIEINPKFWGSLELSYNVGFDFTKCLLDIFVYNKEKCNIKLKSSRKCFLWVLSNIKYLKDNYTVWFELFYRSLKNGFTNSDIHMDDPPELLFSVASGLVTVLKSGSKKRIITSEMIHKIKRQLYSKIMHENLEGILFDLDGTLVNLDVNWSYIKKVLVEQKIAKKGDTIISLLHRLCKEDLNQFRKVSNFIESFEIKASKKIKKDVALISLLNKLKEHNIMLGVVSKQSEKAIRLALENLGILNLIDNIIGRERCYNRLLQIEKSLEALHLNNRNSFFVGDTIIDITSAINAGVYPIAITRNSYKVQQYFEIGIPCFDSVKSFLGSVIAIKQW